MLTLARAVVRTSPALGAKLTKRNSITVKLGNTC